MGDWITEEAARQAEEYSDDPATALAESCLHAGDAHGYRQGLLEALRLVEHEVASGPGAYSAAHTIRALADARADSGQGD